MNKTKKQIIEELIKCKEEINNLEPHINKFEEIKTLYNRKLVKKAVLSKELETFDENFVIKLVKKITPKQEKAIIDYFH